MNITSESPGAVPSAVSEGAEFYNPGMFMLAGRIGRVRYLAYSFGLGALALVLCAVIALATSGMMMVLLMATLYVLMVPASFVLFIRRLNDLDRSGWFSLALLIPFVNFALTLYAMFAPGSADANRFGPPPTPNSQQVWMAAFAGPVIIFVLAFAASPFVRQWEATSKMAF